MMMRSSVRSFFLTCWITSFISSSCHVASLPIISKVEGRRMLSGIRFSEKHRTRNQHQLPLCSLDGAITAMEDSLLDTSMIEVPPSIVLTDNDNIVPTTMRITTILDTLQQQQQPQDIIIIDHDNLLNLPFINTVFSDLPPPPELLSAVSTIAVVTASDMIPFVPCQPLAIALGSSQLGIWAFPICVLGQSMAGVLAFVGARRASNLEQVQKVFESLNPEAQNKFESFKQMGKESNEVTVLLALIGLRLAPFFPFSAGNYLLGGATSVGLRPFIIATMFGCILSNFLSVMIGIGTGEVLFQQ